MKGIFNPNSRIRAAAAGILLALVFSALYYYFRLDSLQAEYRRRTDREAAEIFRGLSGLESGSDHAVLERVNRAHPGLALIAVFDSGLSLRIMSRNDRLLGSGDVFDAIMHGFTGNSFRFPAKGPLLAGFNSRKDGKGNDLAFFLYRQPAGSGYALAVFPQRITGRTLVKVALEIALMLLMVVIIAIFVYLRFIGRLGKDDGISYEVLDLGAEAPNLILEERAKPETPRAAADIPALAAGGSAFLYLLLAPDQLGKRYEWKEGAWGRIEPGDFDTFVVGEGLRKELKRTTALILDEGRRAVIPLAHEDRMYGAVSLHRREPFSAGEIAENRAHVSRMGDELHALYRNDREITDPATGLFSETFLRLKLEELAREKKESSRPFARIRIDLSSEKDLPDRERSAVMGHLAPVLSRRIGKKDCICVDGKSLVVVLSGAPRARAQKTAESIALDLARVRFKIGDRSLEIKPRIEVESSEDAG